MENESLNSICGIVMPISPSEGYLDNHWNEVLVMISDACRAAGLEGRLVSSNGDSEVIHQRIVTSLQRLPIVVCDISSRNPNVMFELGVRLAYGKPTVIIKDDATPYMFDLSPIEYLEYPKSLRRSATQEFESTLSNRLERMIQGSYSESVYPPYIDVFGSRGVTKMLESQSGIASSASHVDHVLFSEHYIDNSEEFNQAITTADELNVIGYAQYRMVVAFTDQLRGVLSRDGAVRFVLIDPDGPGVHAADLRSSAPSGLAEARSQHTASISKLRSIGSDTASGSLAVKVIDIVMPYTVFSFKYADERADEVYVWITPFKEPSSRRPGFRCVKGRDESYTLFDGQFEKLWAWDQAKRVV
ncbi:MAG: hypothetical protein AAF170_04235 [Bacteroidota bacterium]